LNEFTKTKRWRNCKNGLAKVKIIVNWSVQKRKTFENNYSQGRSRMGMPLWYIFLTFGDWNPPKSFRFFSLLVLISLLGKEGW
jgi:hypothetical protein